MELCVLNLEGMENIGIGRSEAKAR